jgi:16S rRNA (guanine966-N2)-methyltransferase
VRITGGRWRSRRLKGPPRGMPLRPTPDALRERAFAVLSGLVTDARVLDLFAGTGAVGLEALSRGAREAVFVERHRKAAALIEANLSALGADEAARVLVRPVLSAVRALVARGERFDLVWADPPFELWEEGAQALEAVATLLTEDGVACLECPATAEWRGKALRLERELAGGASRLLILRPR